MHTRVLTRTPCSQNLALQRSLALERTSVESLRIELGVLATEGQDERAATERCVASLEAANAEQEVPIAS